MNEKKNKFNYWEAITTIAAFITMIWTIHYSNKVYRESNKQFRLNLENSRKQFINDSILNIKQLNLIEKQLYLKQQEVEITQEPIIRITPETIVKGEIGKLDLFIKNFGISIIENIEIFDDYFVALTQKKGPTILYRFGPFITIAQIKIPSINSNETKGFKVNFKDFYKQMADFYCSTEIEGQRMMVARYIIRFTRKADGKRFEYKKAFIIAGNGDTFFDTNDRDFKLPFDYVSFGEIKRMLNIDE